MMRLRGFTLIEILVVIFILGIVATMAVIAVGDPRSRETAHFAEQLKMTLELAEQEAILQPAELGLAIDKEHYQFFHFNELAQRWEPLTHLALFKKQSIPDYLTLQLMIEGKPVALDRQTFSLIVFHRMSNITPFNLTISLDKNAPAFLLTGNENGTITLKKSSSQKEITS